jgi:predicted Zn-dependent protease
MRRLLFLFVLMFCLNVMIFSQARPDTDDGFSSLDDYYLGRAVAANILSTYKLYDNTAAVQYLNRICQALVVNSDYPSPYKGYFVMILDSNEYNAFATPGGHIFITKRLAESAASEDMLAAVIAHELAHIVLRHGITIINESKFENEMSALADMMAGMAASQSAEAAHASNFRDSISKNIDVLMKSGYSQTQEFEADFEAALMLVYAGYDPNALLDIFQILQRVRDSQNSGIFSTHPSPEHRIANLEKYNLRKNDTLRYRAQRFRSIRF